MKGRSYIFIVVSFLLCLFFLIFIGKRYFDTSKEHVLSGQSFRNYPLTGNSLLKNNEERIQFSGNFVNYNGDMSFLLSDFGEFSYENTKISHYLSFLTVDKKGRLMLFKNQPVGLKDLCERGILFNSEAPDFVLTGMVKKKEQDFMYISMNFDETKQEQYCFKLAHDYYLLQFTNISKEEIDGFFDHLEVLR